jgi:hypothetical protein
MFPSAPRPPFLDKAARVTSGRPAPEEKGRHDEMANNDPARAMDKLFDKVILGVVIFVLIVLLIAYL